MSELAIDRDQYAYQTGSEVTVRRQMDADVYRRKISNAKLVTRCIRIALGKREATQAEVTMLGKLLNKILPDLKAVEVTVSANKAQSMQDIEARARAFGIDPKELWGGNQVIEGESAPVQPESEAPVDTNQ